jgi:hypothetical protein
VRILPTLVGATDYLLNGGPWGRLREEYRQLRLALGRVEARAVRALPPNRLRDAEFSAFSQFGEDGIIQYLLQHAGPVPPAFVEFGVGNYTEANTLFLLLNDDWRGLILDASARAMAQVRRRDLYWRHDLTAVASFIDRDNINDLIARHGFGGEVGLLSIDLDGNDYWVWERIAVVNPVLVIAEYNSVFGARRAVSVPYDPAFRRTRAHYSNLYFGCSLKALCHLARRKGYVFVGSTGSGVNAFFLRQDRAAAFKPLSAEEGYVESRFRESRDRFGRLTFVGGAERL